MKDYILVRNKIPVESKDVIYSAESVVELLNDGFYLEKDERFIEYNKNTYQKEYDKANQDLTGQDLDNFLERFHEPDSYDHYECPIQRAEIRMGA